MVIETVTFRLLPGSDEAAFLEADHRVQTEFFSPHPGAMRRTTGRGADGEWIVVILWDTLADAEAASRGSATDDASRSFASFIDASTLHVARYESLD